MSPELREAARRPRAVAGEHVSRPDVRGRVASPESTPARPRSTTPAPTCSPSPTAPTRASSRGGELRQAGARAGRAVPGCEHVSRLEPGRGALRIGALTSPESARRSPPDRRPVLPQSSLSSPPSSLSSPPSSLISPPSSLSAPSSLPRLSFSALSPYRCAGVCGGACGRVQRSSLDARCRLLLGAGPQRWAGGGGVTRRAELLLGWAGQRRCCSMRELLP